MHPYFEEFTPRWFQKAFIYTGSIGDFRYRFAMDRKEKTITLSTYSKVCFELADDIETVVFSWDEDGVSQLKTYIQEKLDRFQAQTPNN